jgi:hypothetical protein
VLVAWYSRDLPMAFNEKDQIFQTATVNGLVCVIIIALLLITDLPTTSPNISVSIETESERETLARYSGRCTVTHSLLFLCACSFRHSFGSF